MKKMKTIFFALGLIVLGTGAVAFTASKNVEKDDDKKCSVKIVRIVNGVKTVIDSTFDCGDQLKWVSNLKGVEGELEEMVEKMMKGLDSSSEINLDIDVKDKDGVKVFKLKGDDGKEMEMNFDFNISEDNGSMKMMFNGEELEIKMDDLKNQLEKLSEEMEVNNKELEDMEFVIEEDGEESRSVKIFKTGGDEGEIMIKKFINGEEVEIGDEDLMYIVGKDGAISISDNGEEVSIFNGKEITVNVEVDDGNEKKVIIITNATTDKKEVEEFPQLKENLNKKELPIKRLKFSPNPNDGKFNLSFKLDEKEPIQIKIFDLQGKEVYNMVSSDFSGRYAENIDISENGEGIYLLQIIQGEKASTSKIVIK